MINCNNCNTEFEGNFCPNCGQKLNSGRIIFKESMRDVLEHYFDFDAPLFRTITGLITRPGTVIREYIFGKRKKYAHPIRYYILVLAVYLIIQSLIDFDPIKTVGEILGVNEQPNPDSPQTKGSYFFRNNINLFLLFFAFFLALFNKLFFRKSGIYFVEYLALGFYVVAQYIFFSLFIVLASSISSYFFLLNYLLVLIYPVYVIFKFHQGKWYWIMIKAFILNLFAWVFYVILGQFVSIFIVILFGL
ncbi:MAG: DUF3667 domain-containing protein [Balneolaceae bacterium]